MPEVRRPVSFGDFYLNVRPYVVDQITWYSPPKRDVIRFPHVILPGGRSIRSRDNERLAAVSGRIVAKSKAEIETAWDRLIAALSKGRQDFAIGYEDARYFVAELVDATQVEWTELGFTKELRYSANFLATDPYAFALAASQLVDNVAWDADGGGLSYSRVLQVPVGGTAPTRPAITIVIPVAGPYGISLLSVRNDSRTPASVLLIAHAFEALDEIVIDSSIDSLEVLLNGAAIDCSGSFPVLDPAYGASNQLTLRAVASSQPTLATTIDWTKRWR